MAQPLTDFFFAGGDVDFCGKLNFSVKCKNSKKKEFLSEMVLKREEKKKRKNKKM
jgi:hypothetical protein